MNTNTAAQLTLSRPRDEEHAKSYPLVKDRDTIFGGGVSDDAAMLYVEAALIFVGDEVGRMVTTDEVAYGATVRDGRHIGRHQALSAMSVLSSWGFVANLGENHAGRYIWARTTKSTRLLGIERNGTWLSVMQARDRAARAKAAAGE
jgi:hypothetical protein